jgi:hypothetical protein
MKSFAECAKEDAKIVKHCFKGYNITPEHAKNRRLREIAADGFRIEGRTVNLCKNARTQRATQAKRGL